MEQIKLVSVLNHHTGRHDIERLHLILWSIYKHIIFEMNRFPIPDKLTGDLLSVADDAAMDWTSKRHDKVDRFRRAIKEAEWKAMKRRLEHDSRPQFLSDVR